MRLNAVSSVELLEAGSLVGDFSDWFSLPVGVGGCCCFIESTTVSTDERLSRWCTFDELSGDTGQSERVGCGNRNSPTGLLTAMIARAVVL
jgi:hypothetical protein